MHRVTAALSGLALTASSLAAIPGVAANPRAPAAADPQDTCNVVPLKYVKNQSAGGQQFTVRANLKVFDNAVPADGCTDGTITDTIGIKGRNNTSLSEISPTTPKILYQTNTGSDSDELHSTGVQLDKRDTLAQGFRTYDVSTDDIPLQAGWYFTTIAITWTVHVKHIGGTSTSFLKGVICERIHVSGANAYLCQIGLPQT